MRNNQSTKIVHIIFTNDIDQLEVRVRRLKDVDNSIFQSHLQISTELAFLDVHGFVIVFSSLIIRPSAIEGPRGTMVHDEYHVYFGHSVT